MTSLIATSPIAEARPEVEAPTTTPADGVAVGPARPALAWSPVLAVAAAKVVLNLLAAGRYGWHRDELYYADAGQHLALGYVDFPSITPLLARLASILFGDSLVGLRLVASLAGAATIVVTAAVTRELGGGRRAQLLATVALTPLLVGANAMFQTVSFDLLCWGLVIWAAAAVLRHPSAGTRHWILLGGAAALAWSTKYTAGMLFACLGIGWLATRSGRTALRGRDPWIAVGIVAVSALPNLWWQADHGWPSVDFIAGRNGEVRDAYPPHVFWLELFLVAGIAAVPLALSGVRSLWRDTATRPLGVALALVAPLWLLAGGKGYYAAPLLIGAFPAGAVAWERCLAACPDRAVARREAWRYPVLLAAAAWLAAPLIAPFLPTWAMVDLRLDEVREDYAEEIGWPEMAATIEETWAGLPAEVRARSVVVASSYGAAGAIERFGRRDDVEIVSGHLQHRYWPVSARAATADHALLVGLGLDGAAELCRDAPVRVATITNRWGVDNEESRGPVWECDLVAPVADLRPRLVH